LGLKTASNQPRLGTLRLQGVPWILADLRSPLLSVVTLHEPHSQNNPAQRHVQRHTLYAHRSEEHTSELQSLMRISYAVFCLKKKNKHKPPNTHNIIL